MAQLQRRPSIYERFSDNQVQRFKQVFLQFDIDGNGHIDEQELTEIMGKLGRPLQPGEAKKYIEMVDIDGTGVIYFEEFLQLLEMQQQEAEALRQYSDIFRTIFNRSGSGLCDRDDLRTGMLTLGHRLSDDEVDEMLFEADEDRDGRLTFEEFAHMLHRVQTEEEPTSKRGWNHAQLVHIYELWATIIEESPKLAQKNSMVTRCARPTREFRRISKLPAQKVRKVGAGGHMLSEIASAGEHDIVEVAGVDADGHQAVYTEPIVITTEGLVLRGDPKRRPKIEVTSKHAAVILRAKRCFLDSFEVVNHGAGPAILVDLGFPDIHNCDCHDGCGGLLVRNRSHPQVSECSFRHMSGYGVCLQESKCILEKCEFSGNSDAGVVVEHSSAPWISECTFTKGRGCGACFMETTAAGVMCHCDVNQNGCPGVLISGGANPTLWKNEIHHGDAAGISVQSDGRGLIEENTLHDNEGHDIEVLSGGNPVVRKNILHDGAGSGIFVEKAAGTIEANELSGYKHAGVHLAGGASPTVSDNLIVAPESIHGSCGISIDADAGGRVLDNLLVGWVVQPRASLSHGIPLHVSGKNDTLIRHNVARGTEEECRAERMVQQLGRHDLRAKKRGR